MPNKSKDQSEKYSLVPATPDSTSATDSNSASESLQEAIDIGLIPIENTVLRGGLTTLLKNIAVKAQARLKYQSNLDTDAAARNGHKLVSEAILRWYEVRGCYLSDSICQEIAKAMNASPDAFSEMDTVAVDMCLGKPGAQEVLQWYLTWFAYFISDIGPLNPTLRHIDLSMDSVNPVCTWITPNMITYMSFIAGHVSNRDHLDLTLSELLQLVTCTRDSAIEQPGLKKSLNGAEAVAAADSSLRAKTMQIPVCLLRLGGYTLAQRLLSSGGLHKVSSTGDVADVVGTLAELFEDDNVLIALPLLLLSESTRQQCLRAIDTSFGMLNAFLQKSVHEKKPDWFVRMLPMQVVSQCMPIIMDVIIGSVLELEDIQEKARTLDEERYLEAKKSVESQRAAGNIVITKKQLNANGNPELIVERVLSVDTKQGDVSSELRNLIVRVLDQLDLRQNHCNRLERFKNGLSKAGVDRNGHDISDTAKIQLDIEGVKATGSVSEIQQFINDAVDNLENTQKELQSLQKHAFGYLLDLMNADPSKQDTVTGIAVSLRRLETEFQKLVKPTGILTITQELAQPPVPDVSRVLDIDGRCVGIDYDVSKPDHVIVVSCHENNNLHYIDVEAGSERLAVKFDAMHSILNNTEVQRTPHEFANSNLNAQPSAIDPIELE